MFKEGEVVLEQTGNNWHNKVIFIRIAEIPLAEGTWHNPGNSTGAQPFPTHSQTAIIKRKADGPEESVLMKNLKALN